MKRLLALLLATLMIFSLVACNKDDTASDVDTGSDITATESDSEEITENDNSESTDDTEQTESTPNNSSSETSTPNSSTSKPAETKCSHSIKYTFDGIANTWSHTGQCSLCKEYFNNNVACADKNKDNICDDCSAKMDFGTAYQNVGFSFGGHLIGSNISYTSTPILYAETIFFETMVKSEPVETEPVWYDDGTEKYIVTAISKYSGTEFEKKAKSLFNMDDAKLSELREVQQLRSGTMVNVYDSAANTYSYQDPNAGGGGIEEFLGYKKISDTEYVVYGQTWDCVMVINCTYTDTVKVSSIYTISTAPSGITKFK